MNENELEFASALTEIMFTDEASEFIDDVRTFEDAGLLTSNAGLVIRDAEGREFQVTIVQSA